MAETIFLSNRRVSFDSPLFTENFKHDLFCAKLTQELQKTVQITDDKGNTTTCCTPKNSNIRISVMQLFQTSEDLGVILFVSYPVANGPYFYLKGENHITFMIDPCIKKVAKVLSGYSILLNDK